MKKKKLTPKVIMVIGAIAICCAGVLIATLIHTNAYLEVTKKEPAYSRTSHTTSFPPVVTITPSKPQSRLTSSTPKTSVSQQAKNVEQPLTSSVSKEAPVPPKPSIEKNTKTQNVLTDKNHKPSYTKKPTATTTTKDSIKEKNTTSQKASDGNITNKDHQGEAYDPLFGWTKSTGGEGTKANDMYEDGIKVGIMG